MAERYKGKIVELLGINYVSRGDIRYDADKIKEIISNYDPDTKDRYGMYFMHYAAQMGMNDILLYLIELGADVSIEERDCGLTPLSTCLMNGRYDTAKILVSNGARLSKRDGEFHDILTDTTLQDEVGLIIDKNEKKDFVTFLLNVDGYLTKEEEKTLRKYRMNLLFGKDDFWDD